MAPTISTEAYRDARATDNSPNLNRALSEIPTAPSVVNHQHTLAPCAVPFPGAPSAIATAPSVTTGRIRAPSATLAASSSTPSLSGPARAPSVAPAESPGTVIAPSVTPVDDSGFTQQRLSLTPVRKRYDSASQLGSDTAAPSSLPVGSPLGSERGLLSRARNDKRIKAANAEDRRTVGKYLTPEVGAILGPGIAVPNDDFQVPNWIVNSISKVCKTPSPPAKKPDVCFDTSPESLAINEVLVQAADNDLEKLLAAQSHTTLHPGNEFRPVEQLGAILGKHENFPSFLDVITRGMSFHFHHSELSESERMEELLGILERGNHKSASENKEKVAKLLAKDVKHGFALPIPRSAVSRLKGALAQPCGMATQITLSETNERVPKLRLTHDASFSLNPGRSVNDRIDLDQYPAMVYGWCLSRLIHATVRMRRIHPDKRILAAKFDYSDAFRRIVHSGSAAAQSILVVDDIAYIFLRMTFGGAPNPPTWCNFSEMACDLVNELMECEHWDPSALSSPQRKGYTTPPTVHGTGDLGPARELAVEFTSNRDTSYADVFIDDIIHIVVAEEQVLRRAEQCAPLVVYATNRPHAGDANEPIPRRNLLGDEKLAAEGTFSDKQIILGWMFNFHSLEISLPPDKLLVWTEDLRPIIDNGFVEIHALESLLGRLNHAAYLLPLGRHFLTRARDHLSRCAQNRKKQRVPLPRETLLDLELWMAFLHRSSRGISMNLLVHRYPTQLAVSDACPFGIGGFLLGSGFAWRIQIPESSPIYNLDPANNVLEFLGMAVNFWLLILQMKAQNKRHECLLVLGDNTSAIGWIFRCSQMPSGSWYHKPVNKIARKLALLLLDSQHLLFTQHLRGVYNTVADILSYSGRARGKPNLLTADSPPDDVLTSRFHLLLPHLIPQTFQISPLPNDVLSWVLETLQTLELSFIRSKSHPSSPETAPGDDGSNTAPITGSPTTLSSIQYPRTSESSWPKVSPNVSEPVDSPTQEEWKDSVTNPYFRELSRIPLATLRRNFGTVTAGRPFISKERLLGFLPSNGS